ncbi:MAG: DUF2339 domain-containing protein [bacterium]|nr:DUF2339 domain-containing protein [bacterium]
MKCPGCKNNITEFSEQCKICNFAYPPDILEKLSLFFELREEYNNIYQIKSNFEETLKGLAVKINKYQKILTADLLQLTRKAPAPVQAAAREAAPEPKAVPKAASKKTAAERRKSSVPEQPAEESPLPKHTAPPSQGIEANIGQKWMLIAGIVIITIGVGYFLKFAFDKGWIGPAGRVAMAYTWGIAFLVAGNIFRKKDYEAFGLSIIGGGIAVLYFSTYAGFQMYGLFSVYVSFFLMLFTTVFACFLAVIYDTKWLALLGLIGGFLTPLMLSTGVDNQVFLMSYMTMLNLGILGIAFKKKWDLLYLAGFICTYILYSGWFASHYDETKFWPAIIFLTIFYFIYSLVPFAYLIFNDVDKKLKGFIIITPNSFIAFAFSFFMIKNAYSVEWVSVITILYALVFLVMSTFLSRKDKEDQDSYLILLAQAALFLIITIPIIFSGNWITVFWASQALILLWLGVKLDRRSLEAAAYILMAITISKLLFYDYIYVFEIIEDVQFTHKIIERYITIGSVLGLLFLFGHLAKITPIRTLSSNDAPMIYWIWAGLLFIVLNIEIAIFGSDYLPAGRFALISILWTFFSVALMFKGFRINSGAVRIVSMCLFGTTILKVFFVDMSRFSTPYRIISFIVLGLVLVGTSFLYYKFKDDLIGTMPPDEKSGEDKKEEESY